VADDNVTHQAALGEQAAFQLANVTKTAPQYGAITPRWLVRLLDWKPLEAGTFRLNRVDEGKAIEVTCGQVDEAELPGTYIQYEEKPKEYKLSAINAVLMFIPASPICSASPTTNRGATSAHHREREGEAGKRAPQQCRLWVSAQRRAVQHLKTRTGPPTPDDLDDLLTKVWRNRRSSCSSALHRGVRTRMHVSRRAPADRHAVRDPVSHLARHPPDPHRQD